MSGLNQAIATKLIAAKLKREELVGLHLQAIDLKQRKLQLPSKSLSWINAGERVVPGGAIVVGRQIICGANVLSDGSRSWGDG